MTEKDYGGTGKYACPAARQTPQGHNRCAPARNDSRAVYHLARMRYFSTEVPFFSTGT